MVHVELISDDTTLLFVIDASCLSLLFCFCDRRWATASFRHYDWLVHSPEAAQAGALVVSGYELYEKPVPVRDVYCLMT